SRAARTRLQADRGLPRRCGPALRARGAASAGGSLCLRRGESAGRWTPEAGSPNPAGRHAGLARFVVEVDECLPVVVDRLLEPIELGEGLDAILFDLALLHRVVAVDEVRGQRVDADLQRLGVARVAIE